jgi:hypothetical protein
MQAAQLLLERGADASIRDGEGLTAPSVAPESWQSLWPAQYEARVLPWMGAGRAQASSIGHSCATAAVP